jgi:hypothetical protein
MNFNHLTTKRIKKKSSVTHTKDLYEKKSSKKGQISRIFFVGKLSHWTMSLREARFTNKM